MGSRVRAHPNFSEAIGDLLQINSAADRDVDPDTAKPTASNGIGGNVVRSTGRKENSTAWKSKVSAATKPTGQSSTRFSLALHGRAHAASRGQTRRKALSYALSSGRRARRRLVGCDCRYYQTVSYNYELRITNVEEYFFNS